MRRLSLLVLVVVCLGTLPASAGDRPALPARPANTENAPTLLSLLWGSFLDLLSPHSIVEGLGAEMDPFGRLSTTTAAPPPAGSSPTPADPDQLGATMDPFG